MARQTRKTKPLIYVFCEGESEQAYTRFLKERFSDTAVIKCVPQTGLFQEAKDKFDKEPRYRDNADVTDEIWFFFDVEDDDGDRTLDALMADGMPVREDTDEHSGWLCKAIKHLRLCRRPSIL